MSTASAVEGQRTGDKDRGREEQKRSGGRQDRGGHQEERGGRGEKGRRGEGAKKGVQVSEIREDLHLI